MLVDAKKEKNNEEWYDKLADMMIVRKYAAHATEGRLMPSNFGYIDVSCFGSQILSTFRLDPKKSIPKLIIYRRRNGGKPGEGIFAIDEGKFDGYSGAKFLHKLITREMAVKVEVEDQEFMTKKEKADLDKLGYREVVIDLWNNSCKPIKAAEDSSASKNSNPSSKERLDL